MKRLVLSLFLLIFLRSAEAAQSLQYSIGTATNLLTTELNAIANNGYASAVGTAYNNTLGSTGNGATRCRLELFITFAAAPTANTAVVVYLMKSADGGSTYEPTPSATIAPGSALQVVFPVNSGQAATRGVQDIDCPPGLFRATVKNDGTGQAATASGHTLKVTPITLQGN